MATSSQKFVARNRAPRVQIEYDVELYGAQKKVQLPFIMGVLADLSGKPSDPLAPVGDRKFLEFDTDNFDTRMKAMKPRAAFAVPNALTGEGDLFMLRVRGESMIEAGIFDGDFVVVRAQPTANEGEIVVAGIPGEEATVKTFRTSKGMIHLEPHNPTMQAMTFSPDEVSIYGKVVTVLRKL